MHTHIPQVYTQSLRICHIIPINSRFAFASLLSCHLPAHVRARFLNIRAAQNKNWHIAWHGNDFAFSHVIFYIVDAIIIQYIVYRDDSNIPAREPIISARYSSTCIPRRLSIQSRERMDGVHGGNAHIFNMFNQWREQKKNNIAWGRSGRVAEWSESYMATELIAKAATECWPGHHNSVTLMELLHHEMWMFGWWYRAIYYYLINCMCVCMGCELNYRISTYAYGTWPDAVQ